MAITAAFGAWVIYRQLKLTQEQLQMTRQALHASERPWVTVSKVITPVLQRGKAVPTITVEFENTGSTPAIHTQVVVSAAVGTGEFPDYPQYGPAHTAASRAAFGSGRAFIASTPPPTKDLLDGYAAGKPLYVYGRVTYSDPIERDQHVTRFCFTLEPGVEWLVCEKHDEMN